MFLRKIGRTFLALALAGTATLVAPSPATADPGPFLIYGFQSGKCIDVPGPTTANVVIDIWPCNRTSTNLQWYIDDTTNGYKRIRNRYSNKCLTVRDASLDNNARVIQYPCVGGDNAEWEPQRVIDGALDWYIWKNRWSHKCLTVLNASTANNAQLVQFQCEGDKLNWYWTWLYPSQW
jgi:beta-agarase